MKFTRIRDYENSEPIAVMGITNTCAMEILDTDGIFVIVRGFVGDLHRYTIRYNTQRPYFIYKNGCRYHIDEFLRV